MKHLIYILAIGALLFSSCEESDPTEKNPNPEFYKTIVPPADDLRAGIVMLEDSLIRMSQDQTNVRKQLPNLTRQALIEKLLLLYRSYPDDKDAASCLDKVHMTYSSLGVYDLSTKFADTLLLKYPKYENRPRVIESIASNYDFFMKPWDREKVQFYYEMLLKENPNLSEQKKEDVKFRLDNIDLSLEELMSKQSEAL